MGSSKWPIQVYEDNISTLSLPSNTLYLSPDAEDVLDDYDSSTSFIIGGIVDKSVASCVSLNKANLCKLKSVRLPLKEHLEKVKKCVLNIDTVVEILSAYLVNKDWKATLEQILPPRITKS
eukprot:TRINITY_DN14132_c0_g1_i1.p1 TRINITY_DN14132_c0_g1~~TRINITY_DN14132_c0_g1_i1.p1  ORF type:complete len:121 (-),score=19.65 TRINITY_DN14132_c0_g1_i1:68-430(-)